MKQTAIKRNFFIATLTLLSIIATGCSPTSTTNSTTSNTTTPITVKKGIENSENAPALVALAKEAKACKFEETFGFSGYEACPAFGKIKETAPSEKNGFKTMMNFIEDESPGVRDAGAHALSVSFYDAALFSNSDDMMRLFTAIQGETMTVVATEMASPLVRFVTNVKSDTSNILTWLKDASYSKPAVRAEFFRLVSGELVDKPGIFEMITAVAKNDKDNADVRSNALYALSRTTTHAKEVKPLMVELSSSKVADVADAAKKLAQ